MIARAGISLADDVRACYRLATTADAPTIARALAVVAGRRTSGTALLRSAAELRGARRDRAVVRLEAALVASPVRERAYVADLYAPLLMAERGLDDVLALLEGYVPRELRAGDHALRSMALAMAGRRDASRDHRSRSIELLEGRTILPARVWQRLATVAFFLDEPDGAIDAARRSVRLALRLHDYRTAMIARSAECSACNATGDCEGEYAAGVDMLAFARRAGDRLLERWSLGICYGVAAEFGESERTHEFGVALERAGAPGRGTPRDCELIARALALVWRGDFGAFAASALRLADEPTVSPAARALGTAFAALGHVALGDLAAARRASREALGLARRTVPNEPVYDVRYRRLARLVAAAACMLVGDVIRGRRALSRHDGRTDADADAMLRIVAGGHWSDAPRAMRGFARAVYAVAAATHGERTGPLTTAEVEVLTLLGHGLSAPRIAVETNRSVHTIRAHTRSAIAKLGVSGRGAAIARARSDGILS